MQNIAIIRVLFYTLCYAAFDFKISLSKTWRLERLNSDCHETAKLEEPELSRKQHVMRFTLKLEKWVVLQYNCTGVQNCSHFIVRKYSYPVELSLKPVFQASQNQHFFTDTESSQQNLWSMCYPPTPSVVPEQRHTGISGQRPLQAA